MALAATAVAVISLVLFIFCYSLFVKRAMRLSGQVYLPLLLSFLKCACLTVLIFMSMSLCEARLKILFLLI